MEKVNHTKITNERWKIINDFPNYLVSDLGNIKTRKTNKLRKSSVGKRGYIVISLRKDNKTYLRTLHRLVAQAFIPNPDNLLEINHKDGNKVNNELVNLEWVTTKDNNIHARMTGLHESDGDKAVIQLDKYGNVIRVYKSVSEASRVTNICRCNINAVIHEYKNKSGYTYKTAGGYRWRYV